MQILAVGAIAQPVTTVQSDVMLAAGKQRTALVLNVCNALASILGFALAVRHGLLAVATAFSVRAYVLALFGVHLTSSTVGTGARTYLRPYVVPGAAAGLMAVAIVAVDLLAAGRSTWIVLLAKVLVGGACYLAAVRALSDELSDELLGLVRLGRGAPSRPT